LTNAEAGRDAIAAGFITFRSMDHDLILPRLFYADGGRVAAARAHGRTANVVSSNVRVRFELASTLRKAP
jgi:hypothetical protein